MSNLITNLSSCKHLAYSNKATFKLEDAKQVYSLLLKEYLGRFTEDLRKNKKWIIVALVYNLDYHRYEIISVIYDTSYIGITVDMEHILNNEPFQFENQVLVSWETMNEKYIENLDRELSLLKFYDLNAKGSQEFPIPPVDVIINVMKCHFDINLEASIRLNPKMTNAVSIELTHNKSMVELVKKLTDDPSLIKSTKNASAEIYQGELLALVYDMLDQIARM